MSVRDEPGRAFCRKCHVQSSFPSAVTLCMQSFPLLRVQEKVQYAGVKRHSEAGMPSAGGRGGESK